MTTEQDMIDDRILRVRGWMQIDVTELEEGGLLDAISISQEGDAGRVAIYILPSVADGVLHLELHGFKHQEETSNECFTVML